MRLRTRVIIVVSILLIMLCVGTVLSGFSRRPQNTHVNFKSNSKTSAVEVEKIEVLNERIAKVTLKNASAKNIDGIKLSSNKGSVEIDFLPSWEADSQRLLPGATYAALFPLTGPLDPFEVTVDAVMFDDKSGDGDAERVKEFIHNRRGYNKELKRLKPLLDAALAGPDADSPGILEKLRSQINAVPENEENDSGAFRRGQHSAREDFVTDIEFIRDRQAKTGKVQIRRALEEAKARHEKRISTGY